MLSHLLLLGFPRIQSACPRSVQGFAPLCQVCLSTPLRSWHGLHWSCYALILTDKAPAVIKCHDWSPCLRMAFSQLPTACRTQLPSFAWCTACVLRHEPVAASVSDTQASMLWHGQALQHGARLAMSDRQQSQQHPGSLGLWQPQLQSLVCQMRDSMTHKQPSSPCCSPSLWVAGPMPVETSGQPRLSWIIRQR